MRQRRLPHFFWLLILNRMNSASFELPSFAKVNWRLKILGRRDDGFHELCTIFQTVSLADRIRFEKHDELTLSCDRADLNCGDDNLIIRAARILQNEAGTAHGAKLTLSKRIPAPGGLGGGSSNAAVALLGLSVLWEIEIGFERLVELAARLGSDVPFFLYGGTALGTGRGTDISPVRGCDEPYLLIVTPGIDVPTATAFARVNAPNLTKNHLKRILKICQNEGETFNLAQSGPHNDFEDSVFEVEPTISKVKRILLSGGARDAVLCGSGASVVGIFDKEETRQATIKALDEFKEWRKFAVATVSRDEYRDAFLKCARLFPIGF